MLTYHKGHTDTIQVYSVTVMTHVKALQAGHSSQGTSEPITTARAGSDTDSPSGKHSEFFGRPVTELVMARAGSATEFLNGEYPEFVKRPVTESVTACAGSNTDFPNGEYSEIAD